MDTIERRGSESPRSYRFALLYEGAPKPMVVPVRPGEPVVIGRSSPADVVINDGSLSRRHARFDWREDGVMVEDLGSTNGSKTNGRPIMRTMLSPGDTITLGAVPLRVRVLPPTLADGPLPPSDVFQIELKRRIEEQIGSAFVVALVEPPPNKPRTRWLPRLQTALHANERLGDHARGFMIIAEDRSNLEARLALFAHHIDARVGLVAYPNDAATAEELIARAERLVDLATTDEPVLTLERHPHVRWGSTTPAGDRMNEVYARIDEVADASPPVLLVGEPGVGKALVAQRLHERSPRASSPFLRLNCATMPHARLDSLMLGIAGDDDEDASPGLFERARGGSLMFENIEHLPPAFENILFRILESGQVVRLGSKTPMAIDARIILTTEQGPPPDDGTSNGALPAILLSQNATVLKVPPLRQRTEEIQPLVELFIKKAADIGRGRRFTEAARHALENYAWPGNLRQLRSAVERAVIMAPQAEMNIDDLPAAIARAAAK
ncbi:MAG: sigma 54-interacting transcriptional regulator [Myxococcota bacterium]